MNNKEIREKRAISLVYITRELIKNGVIDGENYTLNASIVSELVEHYTQDLENLKLRYGITGRANSAKVAGLMAGVIMRYRPMLPVNGRVSLDNDDSNENLAIYHGLVLCAIQSDGTVSSEELKKFVSMPKFEEWLFKFKYFLRKRNHTPESLAFIFDTIGSFVLSGANSDMNAD